MIPISDATDPLKLQGRWLWLSFCAAATGSFMINVDSSVVNVVLPVLSHRFMVSINDLQWVVSSYLLIISALIPLGSRLADWWGRREVFAGGMGLFVFGSICCAMAPSYQWLVLARGFQGLGAAAMMPNQMAIVALIFPQSQRGQAIGLMGASVAAGTLFGPPIGGLLTAWLGWRSIFWINLPIGIWGLWASFTYLPHFPRNRGTHPLDIWGALCFALFATGFELGLSNLHSLWGGFSLAVAGLSLWQFIRQEARHPQPLIPLHLFTIRRFNQGIAAAMIFWLLMMFPAFLTPLFLKVVAHDPIGLIGILMLPQASGMIITAPLGGWMTDRWGSQWPTRIGIFLFGIGNLGFFHLGLKSPNWEVMTWLATIGMGTGLFNSPNNTLILNAVPASDTGLASAVIATQRILARAMGVTLAAIVLSMVWIAAGIGPSLPVNHSHYAQWFLLGFHGAFGVAVGLSAIGFLITTTTRESRPTLSQEG